MLREREIDGAIDALNARDETASVRFVSDLERASCNRNTNLCKISLHNTFRILYIHNTVLCLLYLNPVILFTPGRRRIQHLATVTGRVVKSCSSEFFV